MNNTRKNRPSPWLERIQRRLRGSDISSTPDRETLGAEISPQPLLESLNDPDPQVQAAAAESLANFPHHPEVFEALLVKSHSQAQPVREAAIRSLDVITHIDRTNAGQKDLLDVWFKPQYGGEKVFRLLDLLQALYSDPQHFFRKLGPILLVDLILLILLIVMIHLTSAK